MWSYKLLWAAWGDFMSIIILRYIPVIFKAIDRYIYGFMVAALWGKFVRVLSQLYGSYIVVT